MSYKPFSETDNDQFPLKRFRDQFHISSCIIYPYKIIKYHNQIHPFIFSYICEIKQWFPFFHIDVIMKQIHCVYKTLFCLYIFRLYIAQKSSCIQRTIWTRQISTYSLKKCKHARSNKIIMFFVYVFRQRMKHCPNGRSPYFRRRH